MKHSSSISSKTSDYYAFGMAMPGRQFNSGDYTYGYQSQEINNDIAGSGNALLFEYRVHDTRIGRFLSMDPLVASFPWNSSYAFSENRVISSVEIEGLEAKDLQTGEVIDMGSQTDLKALKPTEYGPWQDMLGFENSSEYENVLENGSKSYVGSQRLNEADGSQLNTDYYAVTIDLTTLPEGVKLEDLYGDIRKNFNDFLNTDVTDELFPYDENSQSTWQNTNGTGAVMVFNTPMDDAAVLTSQSSNVHWVFTPVFTVDDLGHPLAGHREFGMTDNGNGTATFYTRGVDRLWAPADLMYNATQKGGRFFNNADKLWNGVMDNVVKYVEGKGGSAKKTHNFNRRIPWSNVRK